MGAAIPVGVKLIVLTDGKQLALINFQLNALQLFEVGESAEKIISFNLLLLIIVQSAAPRFVLPMVDES